MAERRILAMTNLLLRTVRQSRHGHSLIVGTCSRRSDLDSSVFIENHSSFACFNNLHASHSQLITLVGYVSSVHRLQLIGHEWNCVDIMVFFFEDVFSW